MFHRLNLNFPHLYFWSLRGFLVCTETKGSGNISSSPVKDMFALWLAFRCCRKCPTLIRGFYAEHRKNGLRITRNSSCVWGLVEVLHGLTHWESLGSSDTCFGFFSTSLEDKCCIRQNTSFPSVGMTSSTVVKDSMVVCYLCLMTASILQGWSVPCFGWVAMI